MFKHLLFPLCLIILSFTLLGEDDLPQETPRPASEGYRHVLSTPYIAKPEGITGDYRKITVSPKTFPYPLLRHRLNVFSTENETGNAYPLYVTALKEFNFHLQRTQEQCFRSEEYRKLDPQNEGDKQKMDYLRFKAFPLYNHWYSGMHTEITAEEEAKIYAQLEGVYKLLEKASRKTYFDWSDVHENKGVLTSLEPLHESRILLRYLADKADWEIRNGKYDDAIKTIRTGLALGDFVMESTPAGFMVGVLIGSALKGAMYERLICLSAQPDAPNLYPALMQISFSTKPLITATQSEMLWLVSPNIGRDVLDSLDTCSPEQAKTLFNGVVTSFVAALGLGISDAGQSCQQAAFLLLSYIPAKKRLLAKGLSEQEIEALSAYQIVTPFFLEKIIAAYDMLAVCASMPIGETYTAINLDEYYARATRMSVDSNSSADMVVAMFLPAVHSVREGYYRQELMVDLLKIISAIRYYAAVHEGRLPESLAAITEVAVPKTSPITGKPYDYRVEGNTVIIDYDSNRYGGQSRMEIVVK